MFFYLSTRWGLLSTRWGPHDIILIIRHEYGTFLRKVDNEWDYKLSVLVQILDFYQYIMVTVLSSLSDNNFDDGMTIFFFFLD